MLETGSVESNIGWLALHTFCTGAAGSSSLGLLEHFHLIGQSSPVDDADGGGLCLIRDSNGCSHAGTSDSCDSRSASTDVENERIDWTGMEWGNGLRWMMNDCLGRGRGGRRNGRGVGRFGGIALTV